MAAAIRHLSETAAAAPAVPGSPLPLHQVAQAVLDQRRARTRFLPASLFHEPAWEILLSLYVAQRHGRTVNIKHLTQEVEAPVTTAQRWVDALAHMKLVRRVADGQDRRRIELSLTDAALQAVERYLAWLTTPEQEERPPIRSVG